MPIESSPALSRRLRLVREEIYGDDGGPCLAACLGIPPRTWANYESGVMIPATVVLAFIELTATSPKWLLAGDGPRYIRRPEGAVTHVE